MRIAFTLDNNIKLKDIAPDESTFYNKYFWAGFDAFLSSIGAGATFDDDDVSGFKDFLTYTGKCTYYKYRNRFISFDDKDEFEDHTRAWAMQNAQAYFAKWKATKAILSPDGTIYASENIQREHTQDDTETNTGTNTSTATLTNSKTDAEQSNDFPIYNTSDAGTALDTDYASGTRKLVSNGESSGTNSAQANATRKLGSQGTERETRSNKSTNGKNEIQLQKEYYENITNLTEVIVDDYAQFILGDMLAI